MDIDREPLQGRFVRLEMLRPDHAEGLLKISTSELFTYMHVWRFNSDLPAMLSNISELLARPNTVPYVILADGTVVGTSSFLDISEEHRTVEVGATWIGKEWQSTVVNPDCKLLLLSRAFDEMGVQRVQLKTNSRNAQSRRGIEKLGAKFEGILRNHMIDYDGQVRHTAIYSIVRDEWPEVRTALEQRLASFELPVRSAQEPA